MDKLQHDMKNITQDIKEGLGKVGNVIKHTAKDLKADAQGAMHTMEMKKEDMMERYEEKDFSKKIEKQMKKGMK